MLCIIRMVSEKSKITLSLTLRSLVKTQLGINTNNVITIMDKIIFFIL